MVYNARRRLRNSSERIFINEDLSVATTNLFYEARQLVKDRRIHSSWTYWCSVYINESATDRPKKISCLDDLHKYRTNN